MCDGTHSLIDFPPCQTIIPTAFRSQSGLLVTREQSPRCLGMATSAFSTTHPGTFPLDKSRLSTRRPVQASQTSDHRPVAPAPRLASHRCSANELLIPFELLTSCCDKRDPGTCAARLLASLICACVISRDRLSILARPRSSPPITASLYHV